jgi:hypothetical protein
MNIFSAADDLLEVTLPGSRSALGAVSLVAREIVHP